MSPERVFKESKFTRGEKCIFAHLVVTLTIIISLLIIYIVHVCLVKHAGGDFITISRRQDNQQEQIDYDLIGVAYLNTKPSRVICNTLLLKDEWSLAPAQCTAMRDDPDMADYIPWWRIMYKSRDGKYYKSEIKRTQTHTHFNRDDYSNNVGLFKHQDRLQLKGLVVPSNIKSDEVLMNHANHMKIIGWYLRDSDKGMEVSIKTARVLDKGKCAVFVNSLIDELRNYEFCATFEFTGATIDHGAVLVMGSEIIGFFSWGGIEGRGVPVVILQVSHFRDWFDNIIS